MALDLNKYTVTLIQRINTAEINNVAYLQIDAQAPELPYSAHA